MSANKSNAALQRRARPRAKTGSQGRKAEARGETLSSSVPNMSRYLSVKTLYFMRELPEVSMSTDGSGNFAVTLPPSFSGSTPIHVGSQVSETLPGFTATYGVPMAFAPTFNSMVGYQDFATWKEYQLHHYEVEFSLLCGESYNPTVGSPLPELLMAYDPLDANTSFTLIALQAYPSFRTQVLLPNKWKKTVAVPRPAVTLYNGVTSEYAYISKASDLWINMSTSTDLPHYCFKLYLRNMLAAGGSGLALRLRQRFYFAVRRLY
jgi:hypothetical protein